mgnify:CR=1 FL=1
MTTKFTKFVALMFMLSLSTMALAQQEPSRMTYDLAMKAMEAAEAHARQQGVGGDRFSGAFAEVGHDQAVGVGARCANRQLAQERAV